MGWLIVLLVGWIGGMLHIRSNYLSLLRQERKRSDRAMRYAREREWDAMRTGYAVGYREGQRARGGRTF